MLDRIKVELKEFTNYFVTNIKESTLLTVKYIVYGIYLIILTVIANRFDLESLTYFNAVLVLVYFSEMISYGVSSGINIYINQNIENKEVVKKYISLGFSMCLVIASLFILLLYFSKEFIFSQIMKVNVYDNYLFFDIMLITIFQNIILRFFLDVLKIIKEFKYQLIITFVESVLILIGISAVGYFLTQNIYVIAVSYIVSYGVMLPIILYILKNKTKRISFSFKEIVNCVPKINIKEVYTILSIGLKEIIWNIGYTLSGIILLNKSEILYNSYSYYENMLDVVNGVYFSIITVCSIGICNELGKGNFAKAYKNSKYSIIMSVMIWLCMLLIYILFKGYIISGMNIEIQQIGEYIAFAYLLIQLFRYIDWLLNSYILVLGANVKLPVILDISGLIYFSILLYFAKYLPNNPIILILIVGSDSIIKSIINLIYFKSKKWMNTISE